MARPLTPREVTEMLLADRLRNGSSHGHGNGGSHSGKRRGQVSKRAPASTGQVRRTEPKE